eukprot:4117766-Pleurochrysis_carterae.AAC.1
MQRKPWSRPAARSSPAHASCKSAFTFDCCSAFTLLQRVYTFKTSACVKDDFVHITQLVPQKQPSHRRSAVRLLQSTPSAGR